MILLEVVRGGARMGSGWTFLRMVDEVVLG